MSVGAPHHVVTSKCHTPSRRMPIGASHQVGYSFNVIHHHDGCRLVHPAKWDIGQFRVAFMTDSVGESRHVGRSVYRFNSRCQELTNSFAIQLITSHAINCQTFQISHFQIHMHFCNIITKIYSFHIIISDLFGKLPKHLK